MARYERHVWYVARSVKLIGRLLVPRFQANTSSYNSKCPLAILSDRSSALYHMSNPLLMRLALPLRRLAQILSKTRGSKRAKFNHQGPSRYFGRLSESNAIVVGSIIPYQMLIWCPTSNFGAPSPGANSNHPPCTESPTSTISRIWD